MKRLLLLVFCGLFVFFSNAQTKYVLIEEGTGTWCQWCTSGLYFGEYLTENYPEILVVAIHEGDQMEYTEYFEASGLTSFPSANIDREISDADPFDWEDLASGLLDDIPPADVAVETVYNEGNSSVSVIVTAELFEDMDGDFRLGAIIVEDGVTGPSPDYDQSNSWSGSNADLGGYENLPSPVPAAWMVYNHVARHLMGGYDGEEGSLPAAMMSGMEYSHTFEWIVPEEFNPNYLKAYGVLIDNNTGSIINCGKGTYFNGQTNATPFYTSNTSFAAFVNSPITTTLLATDPDNSSITAGDLGDHPAWLEYSDDGEGTIQLSGTPDAEGSYPFTMTITDGESSSETVFTIEVGAEQNEDWVIVGAEDVSETAIYVSALEVDQNGSAIVAYTSQNGQISVKRFNGATWEFIGAPGFANGDFHMAMDLGPDGSPWIATVNGGIEVWHFEQDNWVEIGGVANVVAHIDIEVSDAGSIYVAGMEQSGTSYVHQYGPNSGVFTQIGEEIGSPAVWNKLASTSNDEPCVLFNNFDSGESYVSIFQVGAWNSLGVVDDTDVYFEHEIAVDSQDFIHVSLLNWDQLVNAYKYDGDSWTINGIDILSGAAEKIGMAIDSEDNILIAAEDLSLAGAPSVVTYDGLSWSYVGLPGFSPYGASINCAIDPNDIPYVAYENFGIGEALTVEVYGEAAVGLEEYEIPSTGFIFPNPSHDNIFFSEAVTGLVEMYNHLGQLVLSKDLRNARELNIDHLPFGAYVLTVTNAQRKIATKVILH